jgi:hypothetical protein
MLPSDIKPRPRFWRDPRERLRRDKQKITDGTVLNLEVNVPKGEVVPGNYPAPASLTKPSGNGSFITQSGGKVARRAGSTAGSVTVATITPTRVTGTYDFTFEKGRFQGVFDAPVCEEAKK